MLRPPRPNRIVVGKDVRFRVRVGHVGLWLEHGYDGGPMIYDPSGSYRGGTRGSGGVFVGEEAKWERYLEFQKSENTEVDVFIFATTPEEEEAIAERAIEQGDPREWWCSLSVSGALSGIGPFKDLKPTMWPGRLAERLRRLGKK